MLAYIIPILLLAARAQVAKADQKFEDPVRVEFQSSKELFNYAGSIVGWSWTDTTDYKKPKNKKKLSGSAEPGTTVLGWFEFEAYMEGDGGRTFEWSGHDRFTHYNERVSALHGRRFTSD
jgi:photosystem II stability/assembly factor-like uncharacterized protein